MLKSRSKHLGTFSGSQQQSFDCSAIPKDKQARAVSCRLASYRDATAANKRILGPWMHEEVYLPPCCRMVCPCSSASRSKDARSQANEGIYGKFRWDA